MEKKRFEYIDAMRGFTMLLVVCTHVAIISYRQANIVTFHAALSTFRMPLFFFISGFILYKASRVWDTATTVDFLKKKFMVQIIPTLFFFVLFTKMFMGGVIIEGLCETSKNGYWFTISLFEFFMIYSLTSWTAKRLNIRDKWLFAVVIPCAWLMAFGTLTLERLFSPKAVGLLQIMNLNYFIYFYIGTCVRKYFDVFLRMTSNRLLMSLIIGIWFFSVLFPDIYTIDGNPHLIALLHDVSGIVSGLAGLTIVFMFFRSYEHVFTCETQIGRWLQYIGRRTLDVYLLHYFFLPRHLEMVGVFFKENPNPTLEFFCTLIIAVMVVSLCLVVSNVMRLSPWMSKYLFGVKLKKK